ncbi:MAG TPA: formate dehydrogenase accessory sulfurtransferase FdhD [Candidatus Dormibacteraeota bacterium]|nr:formate dehydrogenase accessory sulfurtransferase FdhD [Candidatus Dormibacteraeota bacterium]
MATPTRGTRVMRLRDGAVGWGADRLAVEEPLALRLNGETLAVTMRTPGDDFDLAVGFLLSEGAVTSAEQVVDLSSCTDDRGGNVLDVVLAPGCEAVPRRFTVTSACGVCGSASVDAVRAHMPWDVGADGVRLPAAVLSALPDSLRERQVAFERTGGLHAAGLADATGRLLCVREDVGRHNAVDKIVGWAARAGSLPLRGHVLVVSGRASFELVQKALRAGVPALVAVSAPSSLAVDLAKAAGMTLAGFVRDGRMTVYAGAGRVLSA